MKSEDIVSTAITSGKESFKAFLLDEAGGSK